MNEYAICPNCSHPARNHDLEGCTLASCLCLHDQAGAAVGTRDIREAAEPEVRYP